PGSCRPGASPGNLLCGGVTSAEPSQPPSTLALDQGFESLTDQGGSFSLSRDPLGLGQQGVIHIDRRSHRCLPRYCCDACIIHQSLLILMPIAVGVDRMDV